MLLRGIIVNRSRSGHNYKHNQKSASVGVAYHFKRPHTPYPHLELARYTIHIVELDTFPPASPSWLPPEKQELLCHTHHVAAGEIAFDVGA
jgi:hypothetical protein